tara:strand:- start:979 stop:1146 length:168 start_codon:yes stop_codon:yes gene_type:complete
MKITLPTKPLTIRQAITRAKKAAKEGSTAVAIEIFTAIIGLSPAPKYFLTVLFHE